MLRTLLFIAAIVIAIVLVAAVLAGIFVIVTDLMIPGKFLKAPDNAVQPAETTQTISYQKLLEKVIATMSVPLVVEIYENGKKTGVWYQKDQDFRFDSPDGYSVLYLAGRKSYFYIDHKQKKARQVFKRDIRDKYFSPFDLLDPYYDYKWVEVSPQQWKSTSGTETVTLFFDGPQGALSRIEVSGEATYAVELKYLKYGEYNESDFYIPSDYPLSGPYGEGM